MKVRVKALLCAIPYCLLAAVLVIVIFFPKETPEDSHARVVTVWNVDTFEGGKGSRTGFLRSVARKVEKERGGVYFLVTDYTPAGARAALKEGNFPDVLSFGIGLDCFMERCVPLHSEFAGGAANGKCLALPWYKGGYFLFSLTDDFEEEGTCAVSVGGSNLSVVAARYAGIRGEETDSLAAYTGFLNGGYRYLLGTQRDEQRFAARNMTVYRKPLAAYNDLIGYVSVLREGEDAQALLGALLSEETGGRLGEIGMYAPVFEESFRTPSVFSDENALKTIADRARAYDEIKNLDKFLKTV